LDDSVNADTELIQHADCWWDDKTQTYKWNSKVRDCSRHLRL